MTENELRINGKSFDETISQLEEFMESDDVHGELFTVLRSARDFMENLNEEIQQYRAIGTVEGYKRALEISKENFRVSMEYKAKVQEFEAIGTIDEFKGLKEKNDKDFELLLKAVKESYPMFKGAYVELDVFMGDVMRRFTRDRKQS